MRVPCFVCLSIFVLGTSVAGQAATAVTLSPTSGHPSTVVAVSGTNFGANEAVDVYVDQVDTVLLVSSSTGGISGSVTIPGRAAPGKHSITAIGRRTGDAAQTACTASTPWSQFAPAVANNTVFVGSNRFGAPYLLALDAATGGVKWTQFNLGPKGVCE